MKQNLTNEKKTVDRWYRFFNPIVCPFFYRRYGACFEKHSLPKGSNLILSNHVTKADQFLIASFYYKHPLHFVAGENVFRNSFIRRFIEKKFGVIVHMRGVSSLETIKQMVRKLKEGNNVCIFPEGATTFDGRTQKVDSSIAKMAKMSGANLILCNIEGGYLTRPRWSNSIRKGRIMINDYQILAKDIAELSVEAISELINDKLYTDAYSVQKQEPVKYIGPNLCRGLESCLYLCPKCKKINSLTTNSTSITCTCGFKASYDEYGYLTDCEDNQYTITDLCVNQKNHVREIVRSADTSKDGIFLFADDFDCKKIGFDGKQVDNGRVRITAYSDRIEYMHNGINGSIPYSEMDSIFIFLRNTINCRVAGKNYCYELHGTFSTNALKYRDLFEIVKEV